MAVEVDLSAVKAAPELVDRPAVLYRSTLFGDRQQRGPTRDESDCHPMQALALRRLGTKRPCSLALPRPSSFGASNRELTSRTRSSAWPTPGRSVSTNYRPIAGKLPTRRPPRATFPLRCRPTPDPSFGPLPYRPRWSPNTTAKLAAERSALCSYRPLNFDLRGPSSRPYPTASHRLSTRRSIANMRLA